MWVSRVNTEQSGIVDEDRVATRLHPFVGGFHRRKRREFMQQRAIVLGATSGAEL
jgi:hypothetical protein